MLQEFKIGSFSIDSYHGMFLVGCIFFVLLLCWKKHREVYGISGVKALIMAVISIGLGYATTSLMFGLENNMENFSGFSWYGAVFFMPIAIALLFWFVDFILKINTLNYIHNLAAPLALMNGFMKVGCTLYGCCYGIPSSFGYVSYYTGNKAFPIQPIEVILNFAVCGFILWYERRPGKLRNVYPVYMITYSIGRFFVEFGRDNPKNIAGILSGGMVYALIAIVIGIIWLVINKSIALSKGQAQPKKVGGASGWRS